MDDVTGATNSYGVYQVGANDKNYFAGNVGIGTATPSYNLDVRSNSSSAIGLRRASADQWGPYIVLSKARGDLNTPTYPLSGDQLGSIDFGNHNQSGMASVSAVATENHSNSPGNPSGSKLEFSTTPNTTNNVAVRMTIEHNGNVGIGTVSPSSRLAVNGVITVTGSNNSVSVGNGNTGGTSTNNVTFGASNIVSSYTSNIAVGISNNVGNGGQLSTIIGRSNVSNNDNDLLVGHLNQIIGSSSVAIGLSNNISAASAIAIGSSISNSTAGSLMIGPNDAAKITILTSGHVGIGTTSPQTTLQVEGVISPATNNAYTLGSATYRFTEVYATNGVINTSDRREKKDIANTDLGLNFINKLRPVSYRWNTGVDSEIHYGLIAQEAEQVLADLSKKEVTSIVTHDAVTDRYGVRYSELISPLIKAVQELYEKLMGVQSR